jgi:hypothetical protein
MPLRISIAKKKSKEVTGYIKQNKSNEHKKPVG